MLLRVQIRRLEVELKVPKAEKWRSQDSEPPREAGRLQGPLSSILLSCLEHLRGEAVRQSGERTEAHWRRFWIL